MYLVSGWGDGGSGGVVVVLVVVVVVMCVCVCVCVRVRVRSYFGLLSADFSSCLLIVSTVFACSMSS
jgi:hypothetical protein